MEAIIPFSRRFSLIFARMRENQRKSARKSHVSINFRTNARKYARTSVAGHTLTSGHEPSLVFSIVSLYLLYTQPTLLLRIATENTSRVVQENWPEHLFHNLGHFLCKGLSSGNKLWRRELPDNSFSPLRVETPS